MDKTDIDSCDGLHILVSVAISQADIERFNGGTKVILSKIRPIDCGEFLASIAACRVVLAGHGMSTGWHDHPFCELSYVRRGPMRYATEHYSRTCTAGDVWFVPANMRHRWDAPRGRFIISMMVEMIPTGDQFRFSRSLAALAKRTRYSLKLPPAAFSRYAELEGVIASRGIFFERRSANLLEDILLLALSDNFIGRLAGAENITVPEEFFAANAFIEAHAHEDIYLADVARTLSLSPRQVNRIFLKTVGQSCGKYIQERRLMRAVLMLIEHPELPVRAVAEALGYDDELYFSRAFRKRFGKPPSEMRTEHR